MTVFQKILENASQVIALTIFAMVVLIVQWKTVRALNMINNLLLYYGKQIEEIRRLVSSASPIPRESPSDSGATASPVARTSGMYEILMEPEPGKRPARDKGKA
jgi:hypothetical protein